MIITWSPSSPISSVSLHHIYQSTIAHDVPAYSLPISKFHSLITAPNSDVVISTLSNATATEADIVQGFAVTYLIRSGSASNVSAQHLKGSLPLLCVAPSYQNQDVGTALHATALERLSTSVKASLSRSDPAAKHSQIQLGSIFPRIFPGLPEGEEFESAKRWFEKRGWSFQADISIDLYQPLRPGHPPEVEGLMAHAKALGITFGPPKETDDEGLLELEKKEFDDFTVSFHMRGEDRPVVTLSTTHDTR